jgi:hypothetical protein
MATARSRKIKESLPKHDVLEVTINTLQDQFALTLILELALENLEIDSNQIIFDRFSVKKYRLWLKDNPEGATILMSILEKSEKAGNHLSKMEIKLYE